MLDVACGSGELLRQTAKFANATGKKARLTGIDLHELSFIDPIEGISFVRGDAFRLPFADDAFDFAISSLFFHHLSDEQIPFAFAEMSRVARRGVFVIDLERSGIAYYLYKLFCFTFRISPLVTHDGALSVKRGFTIAEFERLGKVTPSFPFRLIAQCNNFK